jgi:hypothetical protein
MRFQLAGLVAFIGLGCVAIVGLHVVMTRPADPNAPKRDVFRALTSILENALLAGGESDLVVLVRPSGALTVFSKGLPEPVTLASAEELKAVLRSLRGAHTAKLLVERDSRSPLGNGGTPRLRSRESCMTRESGW